MPVPKGKISKARRDKRAATKGIKPKAVAVCQTCQAPVASSSMPRMWVLQGEKGLANKD